MNERLQQQCAVRVNTTAALQHSANGCTALWVKARCPALWTRRNKLPQGLLPAYASFASSAKVPFALSSSSFRYSACTRCA